MINENVYIYLYRWADWELRFLTCRRYTSEGIKDSRPIKVFQTDNGKEFHNLKLSNWINEANILPQYCEKDNKKCLGVAERFNRTIKLIIEKYLTSSNSNRWIDHLGDFVANYNSSYHSSIKRIPERLEIFDELDLIRDNIAHNNKLNNSLIQKGDFVRLLNRRGTFEKEGQRFTCKIYLVDQVGLNTVKVQGNDNTFNIAEVLKVSPMSKEIDNSLRKKQLSLFKADKRIREQEGIEPNRSCNKRQCSNNIKLLFI